MSIHVIQCNSRRQGRELFQDSRNYSFCCLLCWVVKTVGGAVGVCVTTTLLTIISPTVLTRTPMGIIYGRLGRGKGRLIVSTIVAISNDQVGSHSGLSLAPILRSTSRGRKLPSVLLGKQVDRGICSHRVTLGGLRSRPHFLIIRTKGDRDIVGCGAMVPFRP